MIVGKLNNVDIGIFDYYSKICISDFFIWCMFFIDEEMFYLYMILCKWLFLLFWGLFL